MHWHAANAEGRVKRYSDMGLPYVNFADSFGKFEHGMLRRDPPFRERSAHGTSLGRYAHVQSVHLYR